MASSCCVKCSICRDAGTYHAHPRPQLPQKCCFLGSSAMVCEFSFACFLLIVLVTFHGWTASFARLLVPWEEADDSERLLTVAYRVQAVYTDTSSKGMGRACTALICKGNPSVKMYPTYLQPASPPFSAKERSCRPSISILTQPRVLVSCHDLGGE